MNWFHGCPSQLCHPQGLCEPHFDSVQQDFTFTRTLTHETSVNCFFSEI